MAGKNLVIQDFKTTCVGCVMALFDVGLDDAQALQQTVHFHLTALIGADQLPRPWLPNHRIS